MSDSWYSEDAAQRRDECRKAAEERREGTVTCGSCGKRFRISERHDVVACGQRRKAEREREGAHSRTEEERAHWKTLRPRFGGSDGTASRNIAGDREFLGRRGTRFVRCEECGDSYVKADSRPKHVCNPQVVEDRQRMAKARALVRSGGWKDTAARERRETQQ